MSTLLIASAPAMPTFDGAGAGGGVGREGVVAVLRGRHVDGRGIEVRRAEPGVDVWMSTKLIAAAMARPGSPVPLASATAETVSVEVAPTFRRHGGRHGDRRRGIDAGVGRALDVADGDGPGDGQVAVAGGRVVVAEAPAGSGCWSGPVSPRTPPGVDFAVVAIVRVVVAARSTVGAVTVALPVMARVVSESTTVTRDRGADGVGHVAVGVVLGRRSMSVALNVALLPALMTAPPPTVMVGAAGEAGRHEDGDGHVHHVDVHDRGIDRRVVAACGRLRLGVDVDVALGLGREVAGRR